MQLLVNAVTQPQLLVLVSRQIAGQIALGLVAKLRQTFL